MRKRSKPLPIGASGSRRQVAANSARPLRFEPLEDRCLLATITVTSLADNGGGALTTLREALAAADHNDTIVFQPGLTGTISLSSAGGGELAVDKSVTIQGPGPGLLTIKAYDPDVDGTNDGDGRRIFFVYSPSVPISVTISGLTLTNGDPDVTGQGEDTAGGGAIRNRDTLTLSNCVITGNSTINGGAIFNEGSGGTYGILTLNDCIISDNIAQDGGGIISTNAGKVTINRTTIENNHATNVGGGILSRGGPLDIVDSTISGNEAFNEMVEFSGVGGGIAKYNGPLNVTSSTITANTGGYAAGGIFLSGGNMTVLNSTISGNTAGEKAGGISSDTTNAIRIRHSTITANSVTLGTGHGGGIVSPESINVAELDHAIVAGNLRGGNPDDLSGHFTASYSLIGNTSNATVANPGNTSILGVANAMLGSLDDNGGPTKTHMPLVGSPARNAGKPDAVAGTSGVPVSDQRGTPHDRILDGRIDIGAVEAPAPSPVPALPGDYNRDTVVDAADYVYWRKTFGATVVQYEGADGNGDTVVNDDDHAVWSENFGEVLPPGGSGNAASSEASVITGQGASGPFVWFDHAAETSDQDATPRPTSPGAASTQLSTYLLALDASWEARASDSSPGLSRPAADEGESPGDAADEFFDELGALPAETLIGPG